VRNTAFLNEFKDHCILKTEHLILKSKLKKHEKHHEIEILALQEKLLEANKETTSMKNGIAQLKSDKNEMEILNGKLTAQEVERQNERNCFDVLTKQYRDEILQWETDRKCLQARLYDVLATNTTLEKANMDH